ncbi:putative nicotinate-nucleotide adenylyltransferase [Koleobacter methoxysyntrophicus]|jgi:nicotinate-nucleotide adenylyltransferase|uniref:Probable nicotinate-nucleotide adenylyltransferase n=1 Tax=Koleobacter methoxysyntrophicus TaxID=2751313 RepID=A0A8A0RSW8_9FIRM|nr:nicotinate-nucleotide adenylyltransferase [Koleobacter methoxysyntrophicus]MDK2901283.1 nicotinate-nucleotide adenylyltransferase [Thermosediminibacterales bacterium]NPV42865.1 nicotinate-nucleotide adenylyltransferase [Bacillota bacterium]QSQ10266.1 putative nicotinate-nucleotide adenylyltransferase [Koleobacter methoxysyntrophicus]
MTRIGIMGGTFDPIHYGHLVTAEAVRTNYNLDYVIFVPTGKPPHKKEYEVTDSSHRYLMTVLATVTNPFFEVSRIEIDREGVSYTIDTIKQFKQIFGNKASLFFISGADAILEIITWKQVDALLDLCYFVAATRPGYELSELNKKIEYIKKVYKRNIYSLEVPAMAISSTDIRKRVKEGRSIKYLLPESVEHYIIKNGLYK